MANKPNSYRPVEGVISGNMTQVGLRLSIEELQRVNVLAKERNISVNALLRTLVVTGLEVEETATKAS